MAVSIGDEVLVWDYDSQVTGAFVTAVSGGSVDVLFGRGSGWGEKDSLTEVASTGALTGSTYTPRSVPYANAPAAGSDPGLGANVARQPSATRPTLVAVTGSWSWSLSATGTVTASLAIKSDSSSTPTTTRQTATLSRAVTVGVTVGDAGTMPFSAVYVVPAGHYYTVATTGSGVTFAVQEQTL